MKMIDCKQAITTVSKQFKTQHDVQVILTTYKRDRRLIITKQNQHFYLQEEGYERDCFDCETEKELLKLLKKKIKIEFPRSHKLYMATKEV